MRETKTTTDKGTKPRRRKLEKSLKPSWVFAIALGSSVGWGAFILPGDWIRDAGPAGAMLGLFFGALIMMVIASSYGVMIKEHPVSGGGFTYAYLAAGKTWAFLCGWFLSLGYISIVALNASAFTLLLKYLMPGFMKQGYLYSVAGWDIYMPEVVIASVLLIAFAFLNSTGTSVSGRLQFWFSILLVTGVFILGAVTFGIADEPIANMGPMFSGKASPIMSVLLILAIAPWAYVGFDNVPQAAEEFSFSPRKATFLIVASLFTSFMIYAVMIGLTAWTFPGNAGTGGELWATGAIVSSALGKTGLFIMAVAIVMGIFTGLNGFYMSSSRLLFSMARARALPAIFRKTAKGSGVPVWGIWFVTLITLPAMWLGRPALSWIVDMSSTGVSIGYFFACFAAYKILARKKREGQESSTLKRVLAGIGMISSAGFLVLLLVPASPASLTLPSYLLLGAWALAGIVFYAFMKKSYLSLSKEETDYYMLGKEPEVEKPVRKQKPAAGIPALKKEPVEKTI
ncbi:APC family permease [Edaphobacillus lindanitolerans]|uniref:Amino acid/polyamine/organocation transporter, APC superfamily n=1 Tax=Edaphobacillus lindanitolerans TaxID=550447 RepID=A0A1U7PQP4_9BACI|nr:APC family permease [Edaphobacillus lindanitolerans]SIT84552.1 amino acid/polyamine/organocation transporter, APC superfamily [Edaphobacillus lindanitolerans]